MGGLTNELIPISTHPKKNRRPQIEHSRGIVVRPDHSIVVMTLYKKPLERLTILGQNAIGLI